MFDIPCVIFAGGRSSRMGEDKALLPFGGFDTLTQFQLSRLQKIFKTVYISCKSKKKFDFQASFIEDVKTQDTYAPTAGFLAMFEALQSETFFVLSVDAPFVSENEINKLIEADTQELDACIAQTAFGIQPMCGIYHRCLHSRFKKMLLEDTHKLGFLLKNSNTKYINFKNEEPFLNLNNPKEYEIAKTLIKHKVT